MSGQLATGPAATPGLASAVPRVIAGHRRACPPVKALPSMRLFRGGAGDSLGLGRQKTRVEDLARRGLGLEAEGGRDVLHLFLEIRLVDRAQSVAVRKRGIDHPEQDFQFLQTRFITKLAPIAPAGAAYRSEIDIMRIARNSQPGSSTGLRRPGKAFRLRGRIDSIAYRRPLFDRHRIDWALRCRQVSLLITK